MQSDTPEQPDTPIPDGECADVALAAEQIAEDLAAVIDVDRQDILILKTLKPVFGDIRQCTCAEESPRVRFAADMALVAICERVQRMMRRDLPADRA